MFVYYINVPENQQGVFEFDNYLEEMPNVKTYELTKAEFDELRKEGGLFEAFDSKLGTIIDVCEEERIDLNRIPEALLITEALERKIKNGTEKKAVETIKESLEKALSSGTFWEIDIYLE